MKLRIVNWMMAMICGITTAQAQLIVENPTMDAATLANTTMQKKEYKEQNDNLEKTATGDALIAGFMEELHRQEDRMLNYLSTCGNTFVTVHDVVDIGKMITEIPNRIQKFYKALEACPKGAGPMLAAQITSIRNKGAGTVTNAILEMTTCGDLLRKLVTNVRHHNIANDSVALLNSNERMAIVAQIRYKLNNVIKRLEYSTYCVNVCTWMDVIKIVDKHTWSRLWNAEYEVNRIIRSFRY